MDNKIDLNQAERDTLAGLPGIGEKLADRIIEYRESGQPFSAVAELAAVPGISENMVREIEDQVTVAAAPEADAEEAAAASAEQGSEDQLTGAAASETDGEEPMQEYTAAESAAASAAPEVIAAEQGEEDQLDGFCRSRGG